MPTLPGGSPNAAILDYYNRLLRISSLFELPKNGQACQILSAGDVGGGAFEVSIPGKDDEAFAEAYVLVFLSAPTQSGPGAGQAIAALPAQREKTTDGAGMFFLEGTVVWNEDIFPLEDARGSGLIKLSLDEVREYLARRWFGADPSEDAPVGGQATEAQSPFTLQAVPPDLVLSLAADGILYAIHGEPVQAADPGTATRGWKFYLVDGAVQGNQYNRSLVELTDRLIARAPATPTPLGDVATLEPRSTPPARLDQRHWALTTTAQLGHASCEAPLNASQRLAVSACCLLEEGHLQAVNGPPGTGKTSLLKSAIAHQVVASVHEMPQSPSAKDMIRHAPLVLTSSTNRTAVTNVLRDLKAAITAGGAFGGHVGARWLPQAPRYGWIFSGTLDKDDPGRQQWLRLDRRKNAAMRWTATLGATDAPALESLLGLPGEITQTEISTRQQAWQQLASSVIAAAAPMLQIAKIDPQAAPVDVLDRLASYLQRVVSHFIKAQQRVVEAVKSVEGVSTPLHVLRSELADLDAKVSADKQARATLQARLDGARLSAGRATAQLDAHRQAARRLHKDLSRLTDPTPLFLRLTFRGARERRRRRESVLEAFAALAQSMGHELPQPLPDDPRELAQAISAALGQYESELQQSATHGQALVNGIQQAIGQLPPPDSYVPRRELLAKSITLIAEASADLEALTPPATKIVEIVQAGGAGAASAMAVGDWLDTHYRFYAFQCAARYWEVAWLICHGRLLDEWAGRPLGSVPPSLSDGDVLRLAAMLGPCIGGTLQGLAPALISGNSEPDRATLAIFDEAGQCAPHLGVPMLSLASRALVIGDIYQLEPIYNLEEPFKRALTRAGLEPERPRMRKLALLCEGGNKADRFPSRTAGSLMRAASKRTAFADTEEGQGITLREHYRCRPEIIGFCRRLIYGNDIEPMRHSVGDTLAGPPGTSPWPVMGFVAVDGEQTSMSGSAANLAEADLIVDWLIESRARIEATYPQSDFFKSVAVLSPYRAQIALIIRKLQARLPASEREQVGKTLVVNTVHALQGAQAKIVVMSLVTSEPPRRRSFLDRSGPNLLNVAVSRAEDHFFVFASRKGLHATLGRSTGTPVGDLLHYVQSVGQRLFPRRVVVIEAGGKREAVQEALGLSAQVIDTGGFTRELAPDFDPTTEPAPRWKPLSTKPLEVSQAVLEIGRSLDGLYLATDDDDAGEAIAWHLLDELRALTRGWSSFAPKTRRMRLRATDRKSVLAAIGSAGPGIDPDRVRAQLAQDVLDRLQYRAGNRAPAALTRSRTANALLYEMWQRHQVESELRCMHMQLVRDGHGFWVQVDDALYPSAPLAMSAVDRPQPTFGPCRFRASRGLSDVWHVTRGVPVVLSQPPRRLPFVLSRIADELGIPPWEAMPLIEDLYLGQPVTQIRSGQGDDSGG